MFGGLSLGAHGPLIEAICSQILPFSDVELQIGHFWWKVPDSL